jgi:hypothetical protein
MSQDRHQRVLDLFAASFELNSQQRKTLLDRECGSDAELRVEIEDLLARDDAKAGSYPSWHPRSVGIAGDRPARHV